MSKKFILSIDQGTTSSKATLFDDKGGVVKVCQKELKRYFPKDGYVEQVASEIIDVSFDVVREVLKESEDKDIATLGIVNQRETVILWNNETGEAIYNAIVWQDRRTDDWCKKNRAEFDVKLKDKTGLLLDAYFCASKIKWVLENVEQAQDLLKKDKLICGTVDCFLLWHLTCGKKHYTDVSNASRTLLLNINNGKWDDELLEFFGIEKKILPEVKNSCDDFGEVDDSLFGRAVKINAMIGDQQAATIGQGCFKEGMSKITFGTGCFLMVNSGKELITSNNGLLTTILYGIDGELTYALEGSCFYAGAVMKWLKDDLGVINDESQIEELVMNAKDIKDLYFVPAFGGMGAPHWKSDAKGLIKGITNQVGKKEIVKAALDGVVLQSYDLVNAMEDDGVEFSKIRVDGGMVQNNWFNQRLATILIKEIEIPKNTESTSLGAALFAGYGAGLFSFSQMQDLCAVKEIKAVQDLPARDELISGWNKALELA